MLSLSTQFHGWIHSLKNKPGTYGGSHIQACLQSASHHHKTGWTPPTHHGVGNQPPKPSHSHRRKSWLTSIEVLPVVCVAAPHPPWVTSFHRRPQLRLCCPLLRNLHPPMFAILHQKRWRCTRKMDFASIAMRSLHEGTSAPLACSFSSRTLKKKKTLLLQSLILAPIFQTH